MPFLLGVHYIICGIILFCSFNMAAGNGGSSGAMEAFLIILGAALIDCVVVFAIYLLEYRRLQCSWPRSLASAFIVPTALAGTA